MKVTRYFMILSGFNLRCFIAAVLSVGALPLMLPALLHCDFIVSHSKYSYTERQYVKTF